MSTATMAPSPKHAASAADPRAAGTRGKVTLSGAFTAEWIKFRTLRSSWYGLGAAVVAFVVLGGVIAYLTKTSVGVAAEDAVPSAVLQGFMLSELLIAVLGVLFVSGEYGTGMIRSTLAAVPSRVPVVVAKAGVFAAVVLIPMTATSVLTFLGAEAVLASSGHGYSLSDPTALRVVLGTAVYLTLIGLLGSALGWLLRSTAAGISALLGLLLVVPVLFQGLLGSWGKTVGAYLPGVAGESFISSIRMPDTLTPWAGLAVLVAWVALALVAATVQLRRRDA